MQTIKTGVVVALLLAVCYGAFVALNTPEPDLPDELLSEFDWNPDDAELDNLMDIEMPDSPGLSGIDVQLPAAGGSGLPNLPALSGTGTSDMPNISLPTLPSLSSSNVGEAAAPSGTSPTPGLPSLPTGTTAPSGTAAAGNVPSISVPAAFGSVNPTSPTSAASLPAFPSATFPASDGPAVSVAAGISPTAGATTSSASTPASTTAEGPTHAVSTSLDTGKQLPLLNTPADANQTAEPKQQPTLPFTTAREQALQLAGSGKLRDALQMLSGYYNSPELNSTQHADLVDLLDALSKEVIYSQRHLAEPAYTVTATDTLESLAAKYQITPELLAAINRLGDSKALIDGSQLKVLPGPFRAEVSLTRQELTLFMGELYAGRFPVSFGKDPSPVEGTFEIVDRRRDRTYFGAGGKNIIPADDPKNPYGGYWLRLGQDLCIHGTAEMASDGLDDAGCISLAPLDAADVYNILAQSNQVNIVR